MTEKIDPENLKNLEVLGAGACATVYKDRDKALKVAKRPDLVPDISNIIGIKNGTCIFPEEMLEDTNGNVIGYIMEYVNGPKLGDYIDEIDFDFLSSMIGKVEEDIQALSQHKILFSDLNVGNIIYDTNSGKIKIVDTDDFKKNQEISVDQVYRHNIGSFNTQIETIIGLTGGVLSQFFQNNSEYHSFYREYLKRERKGENTSINEVLQVIRSVAEKEFGTSFKNLGQLKAAISERTQQNKESDGAFPIFEPPTNVEDNSVFESSQESLLDFLIKCDNTVHPEERRGGLGSISDLTQEDVVRETASKSELNNREEI